MKLFFFLAILVITNVQGQDFPRFNPLIDAYKQEYVRNVFEIWDKSDFFKGHLTSDSVIIGNYQGQKIQLKKVNGLFFVELNLYKTANYKSFLKAARSFFVKDDSIHNDSLTTNNSCNTENFRKPDFKEENLLIDFSDCLDSQKRKHNYIMIIRPGPKFCGN